MPFTALNNLNKIFAVTGQKFCCSEKRKNMNCKQAKELKIEDFLKNQGEEPTRTYGDNFWYKAPYRKDSNPSFKLNIKKQIWYDVSSGIGGNILDLVMLMFQTDLSGALEILEKPGNSNQSFFLSEQQETYSSNIEIKHLQPLQNRALIEYLQSRKITPAKAANYVQEAYYTTYKEQVKPFFAIAFKNDLGGFELRNGFKSEKFPDGFKGGSTPKTITTITGQHQTALNIFEGFFNFVSALQYYNATRPRFDTIVLNSTTNVDTVLPILQQYQKINLFLDNDTTGNHATDTIKQHHHAVVDYRYIYSGQNDMNDFLTAGNPAQINN
jgi:hypothetical protein